MAISKKTFNQIIKQNTFSGADAGKVLIMDWVNLHSKGTRLLSDNEFSQMLGCMSRSPKQVEIYNAYKSLKSLIEQLYGFYQTAYCQYELGRTKILTSLLKIANKRHNFDLYTKQPLLMTEKEYSKLSSDALKDFENKEIPIYAVYMFYTADLIHSYTQNKDIPENLKTLIESYKGKTVDINYEESIDFNREKEESKKDNNFIKSDFCKKYEINNTDKSIRDFILTSPLMYPYTLDPNNFNFILDKEPTGLIEVYENEREKQAKYNNEKYITVFEKLHKTWEKEKREQDTTTETRDKFESLIEWAEWLTGNYSIKSFTEYEGSKESLTEIWNDLTEYSELLEVEKAIFSKKIKKLGSISVIGSDQKDTIKEKELLKVGLDTIRNESEIVNKYFLSITDKEKNNESYIKWQKVYNAGIAVYKEKSSDIEKNLLKKFSDENYIFSDISTDIIKNDTKDLIEESLCMYLGNETIYSTYSEIFKVDLTPLSQKWNIDGNLAAYNWLLYNNYNRFRGTKKQVEADRQKLKKTFKPLDKSLYRRSPEELEQIKESLLDIPLKETLNHKYIKLFLEGANIRYDV